MLQDNICFELLIRGLLD